MPQPRHARAPRIRRGLAVLMLGLAPVGVQADAAAAGPCSAGAPRYALEPGTLLEQRLAFHERLAFAERPGIPAGTHETTASGTLEWRVYERRAEGWLVGYRFIDLQLAHAESAGTAPEQLNAEVLALLHEHGRLSELRFPPDMLAPRQRLLAVILADTQLSLDGARRGCAWPAEEQDLTGRYGARYTLASHPGGLALERHKGSYLSAEGTSLEPQQLELAGHTQVLWSRLGHPLQLRHAEQLRDSTGKTLERTRELQLATLTRTPRQVLPDGAWADARRRWDSASSSTLRNIAWNEPGGFATHAEELAALRAFVQDVTLTALLAQLRDHVRLGSLSSEASLAAWLKLAALLRLDRHAVTQLVEQLDGDRLPPEALGYVMTALGDAGTPAAQAALVRHSQDARRSLDWRQTALVALGNVAQPSPATEGTLLEALKGSDAPLAQQAALSLGRVARALRAHDAPRAAKLVDVLLACFQPAHSRSAHVLNFLSALGNTGDPRVFDTLRPFLHDSARLARLTAVSAIAQLPHPQVEAALVERAVQDDTASLRANALQALALPPSPLAFEAFARAVSSDPDPEVRRGALALLAAYASDPAIHDLIADAADRNTASEVRQEARRLLAR